MFLQGFVAFHKQRVVFDGQHTSCKKLNAGVPKDLILGLFLFDIYIKCVFRPLI